MMALRGKVEKHNVRAPTPETGQLSTHVGLVTAKAEELWTTEFIRFAIEDTVEDCAAKVIDISIRAPTTHFRTRDICVKVRRFVDSDDLDTIKRCIIDDLNSKKPRNVGIRVTVEAV